MNDSFDVLVVGGGPAGLCVAAALCSRKRTVALFERSGYDAPRVGETFGGEIQPLLRSLGAWDALHDLAAEPLPFREVRFAWGSATLGERPSMFHPMGEGWHVDRARFDARLARWAESQGVSLRVAAGPCTVTRIDGGFHVAPTHGLPARGRYLVDASGRGAPASAPLGGRRWVACDRQVALVARMTGPRSSDCTLLVEAVEEGWWYSAPQPDGALVVTLITDADLVPAGGRSGLAARFSAALFRAAETAARVAEHALVEPIRIVRAEPGRLLPDRGPGWRAIGDAALASDPLAGNGVARAIASACDAAPSIDRAIDNAPALAADDAALVDRRFADHLARRDSFCLGEARWPDAPFWARRRPVDWRQAPITLNPRAMLERAERQPSLARVEALLPPRAIAALFELLEEPHPAHVALGRLKEIAPLGDRRLLVGLQSLIELGALRIA